VDLFLALLLGVVNPQNGQISSSFRKRIK